MSRPDRQPTDPETHGRPHTLRRGILSFIAFLLAVGIAVGIGGFLQFAAAVADLEPSGLESAEGIVALTGGRDRIHGALELLRSGHGRRLLITGVHPLTRPEDLRRQSEGNEPLFACCVDLGFEATTTVGNAQEAAVWAKTHGFHSLVIVTSAYHMPRSLTEFADAMPDVSLVAYPVRHPDLDLGHWYLSADTAKLLISEYLKYTVSRARQAFEAH
ncbi:MAG: YdcF family protein [Ancalomicrobiaceae bacterium]|nr:YdcF family protein [Ancalomicrobiaceae bacterium]